MSETAIRIENLSKRYQLQHKLQKPDSVLGAGLSYFKSLLSGSAMSQEEFWALKDINLEISQGDRVGIIGRNGAGKSTLLKILSRIVKPSSGRVEFNGRMASLLEVGTGFHGDLTGRENIYLNGSILGMHKREIDAHFDEIVAFSEVERFLDTPVKRYSSGMYVRLAFAVAAHLEPEILIVDEVLAVGDAAFQKKCLGKMQDVSTRQGRTILFVSHSMDAVQKLCNKGLLLDKGKLMNSGPMEQVVAAYISNNGVSSGIFNISHNQVAVADPPGRIISVSVIGVDQKIAGEIPTGAGWQLKVKFELNKACDHFVIGIGIQGLFGDPLNTSWSVPEDYSAGIYEATYANDQIFYTTGHYKVAVGLSSNRQPFYYNDTEAFIVISDAGIEYENERMINRSSGLILNMMPVSVQKAT
jgi:lipopolysaccharide transport system ATP-binding protein